MAARRSKYPSEFLLPMGISLAFFLLLLFLYPSGNQKEQSPELGIHLSKKALWRLQLVREEALRKGVLTTDTSHWVPARINDLPARIRLKGDWTDHLQDQKWSFRVNLKDSSSLLRFREFSLQAPETRDFLHEWVFHKMLQREGHLSPRYRFVHLRLNGSYLGMYAMEEHFRKEMLESQGRRDGPILRFNEDGLWDARARHLKAGLGAHPQGPWFEAGHAEPFQKKKLSRDSLFKDQQAQAQVLMEQYRNRSRPPSEIFDLNQMALNYALTDLALAHHSFIWHNRRFYFNPITLKLEPVSFDAYSGEDPRLYANGVFTAYGANGNTFYNLEAEQLGHIFTGDARFLRLYYRYLWLYSQESYLDRLFEEIGPELGNLEQELNTEYLGYRYDRTFLYNNASAIRDTLENPDLSLLKWSLNRDEKGKQKLCLQNYLPLSVELLGWETGDSLRYPITPGKILFAYDRQNPADFVELSPKGPFLYLRVTSAPVKHIKRIRLDP